MRKKINQMAVRYRSLADGDGIAFKWESSLDKILTAGNYAVEIEHYGADVGLPIEGCGTKHSIVGTLVVTDSGALGNKQGDRVMGQVLTFTQRESKETSIYTRTYAGGEWGAWRTLARTGMYDEITNPDELYASVAELVTQTQEINACLTAETKRAQAAEEGNAQAIAQISQYSKNLLNPNDKDIKSGYYQGSGAEISNSDYNLSGYIPVKPNTTYHFSTPTSSQYKPRFIALFNEAKTNLGSKIENVATVTTTENTLYMRLSVASTVAFSDVMVEEGEIYTGFVSYGANVRKEALPAIDGDKIANGAINEDKLSDELRSKVNNNSLDRFLKLSNLVDRETCVDGRLNTTNGNIIAGGNTYKTTDYISVDAGTTYYIHPTEHTYSARCIATYDSDKSFLSSVEYKKDITPTADGYIRVTFQQQDSIAWEYAQVTKGERLPYTARNTFKDIVYGADTIPMNAIKNISQLQILLGGNVAEYIIGAVSAGNLYETTLFPQYIKQCNCLSFSADITTWGNIVIGKGYNSRNGIYVKINDASISWCWFYGNETVIETKEHSLDLINASYIRVSIISNIEKQYTIFLNCDKGSFNHTITIDYDMAGKGFLQSDSAVLNNAKLSYTNPLLKKSIWVFGDSYTSLTADRWTGVLHEIGIKNYMLCGIPGGYSQIMYNDALCCLNYGTPKYIVWCLGMNDRVSGSYSTYMQQLKAICENRGIQLVLMKIPQVPTPAEGGYKSIEEAVNKDVIASGLPYIDAYRAVGANVDGQWYEGMLSSDNIHPTKLGAQALASGVLADFPQFFECC